MKVITISGKAQAGKDTTARLLKDKLTNNQRNVMILHYADLLKWQAATMFGWDGKKDEAGRTLLQHLGTEIVRKKNPHYWVTYLIETLKVYDGLWDYVLIPDARFENEIIPMKNYFDSIAIRIESIPFDSGLTEEQKNHPSETALDDFKFDYYVHNDRTLEGLGAEVDKLIQKWGE